MSAITSLMEHGDGKFKMTASIFGGCLSAFLFSWLLIFGVGGAVGIAIGVSIAVISLVLTAVFGAASVFIYLDWLDKG
jgi:hypothetical protein